MRHSVVTETCQRKPLASLSWHDPRIYHEFDNVLLIVFFSHARYDVNLDNYKKVRWIQDCEPLGGSANSAVFRPILRSFLM